MGVVEAADVGVVELGGDLNLEGEAGDLLVVEVMGVEGLDGDLAVGTLLDRQPHGAHPTLAELLLDGVALELRGSFGAESGRLSALPWLATADAHLDAGHASHLTLDEGHGLLPAVDVEKGRLVEGHGHHHLAVAHKL